MDATFCTQKSINAKLTKNSTSSEMIDTGRDFKNMDKMRPSAASLVQRYTRNGKHSIYTIDLHCNLIDFIQDPEIPKIVRPPHNLPKSKLTRSRTNSLRKNRNELNNQSAYSADTWTVKSGCHFSCIENSMGIQIISSNLDQTTNIQLCHAEFIVRISK